MGEHVARMGEMRNTYKILVRKPEGNSPRGICWRRLDDNIRLDLRETGWERVDWMYLAQNRYQWRALVNTVTSLRVT
jgi:hypothetical protein